MKKSKSEQTGNVKDCKNNKERKGKRLDKRNLIKGNERERMIGVAR